MKRNELNRRDFSKWSVAALGGLVAGTTAGCGGNAETPTGGDAGGESSDAAGPETTEVAAHACRGLNDCKTASNECRGQGTCATEAWHHDCAGMNDCKGQGGCGENPLANTCEGKGSCAIPLMDAAWDKARKSMEAKWEEAGKEFGSAPAQAS
ncbi:MAG: hypothetical protein HUJ26_20960 [Planctomycetaceae bacterium]|nr:hypothetical protein [Planctomycetaceae bacterium]